MNDNKKIPFRRRLQFAWRLLRSNPVMFGMKVRSDPGRALTIGPMQGWPGPVRHAVVSYNNFDAPGGTYVFEEQVPLEELQRGR